MQVKKDDKSYRIDEETSESAKTDSVSTIVNDAECTDLTPPVDMEVGVGRKMTRMIEQIKKQVKVKKQIL